MHGANRLGGNSLSDLLVFGKRAGEKEQRPTRSGKSHAQIPAELVEGYANELREPFNNTQGENPYTIHQDLQDVMQLYIGVFRTEENIQKGIDEIEGAERRGRKYSR